MSSLDIVCGRVVCDGDEITSVGDREGNIGSRVRGVPQLVEGDLDFVVTGGNLIGGELVDAVTVCVLEPREQTIWLPFAGAAEFGLEVACSGCDDRVDVVSDPMTLVVVEELHVGDGTQREVDVGTIAYRSCTVVLVPGFVQRCLVLPGTGRDGEDALPDIVAGVVDKVGGGTVGLPVTGTAQFVLERTTQS